MHTVVGQSVCHSVFCRHKILMFTSPRHTVFLELLCVTYILECKYNCMHCCHGVHFSFVLAHCCLMYEAVQKVPEQVSPVLSSLLLQTCGF